MIGVLEFTPIEPSSHPTAGALGVRLPPQNPGGPGMYHHRPPSFPEFSNVPCSMRYRYLSRICSGTRRSPIPAILSPIIIPLRDHASDICAPCHLKSSRLNCSSTNISISASFIAATSSTRVESTSFFTASDMLVSAFAAPISRSNKSFRI